MTAQPIRPTPPLDVRVDLDHVPPAIHLVGALDYECEQALTEAADRLASATRRRDRVVLDLAGVTFCDIAGLRVLEGLAAALGGCGREVTVRHPSRAVMRLVANPRSWVRPPRMRGTEPGIRGA